RPFGGIANADVIVAILEREPEPLFGISEPADPVLRTIQSVVNKALRKDPAERYQTAAEMRTDLAQIKQELAVEKDSRSQRAISLQTSVSEFPEIAARTIPRKMRREILVLVAAAMLVALFAGLFLYQRYKSRSGTAPAATVTKKPYLQMSPAEQLVFVEAQEQRISAMMGDRPVKLNDEALRAIKTRVDRYAARQDSASLKEGQESLRTVFARATPQIPIISRAFNDRRIPIVIGVYLPMIESEYKPCYENQFGAKGLFQFMPSTAEHYGVARSDMCDVQKIAPAAAHYIADRMAELGDDSQSMTLVLLSYNRGPNGVTDALRRLREIDVNYERNFWTLFANRDKLDQSFQRESAGYVPQFFAAAIIGENPESFDLQMPPLSSMASAANEKR
ncbi:MAG: transglycosylase SLT domain-containing protein, partial [Pyrinomonadaceae bacterium]